MIFLSTELFRFRISSGWLHSKHALCFELIVIQYAHDE